MTRKPYAVDGLLHLTIDYSLKAKNEQGIDIDIISSTSAKRYISRKYGSFAYFTQYVDARSLADNIEQASVDFSNDYYAFKTLYAHNIQRMYDTVMADYNPVENYNLVETHTGSDTGLKTPTNWKTTATQTPNEWKTTETQTPTDWKESETQTPTNWESTETQTPTDWVESATQTPNEWKTTTEGLEADNHSKSDNSVYGFNSEEAVPSSSIENKVNSKTETAQSGTYTTETERSGSYETKTAQTGTFKTETERTGSFETETAQSGTFTTETAQSGTYEDKMTYDTELTRHGNIGVSESSQLAENEIKFRLTNIAYQLLDLFIKEHCVYSDSFDMIEGG